MKATRDDILKASVRLFAELGYDAVSTSMIAGELGMTKGALYRHFASKRDIFKGIVQKMFELDAQRASEDRVPEKPASEGLEPYGKTALGDFCGFVCNQFAFWTEDEFASNFRKMMTLSQFADEESGKLYQDCLVAGPVKYSENIFNEMIREGKLNDDARRMGARRLAIQLAAPLMLMIQLHDGGMDGARLKADLKALMDDFERRWSEEGDRSAR